MAVVGDVVEVWLVRDTLPPGAGLAGLYAVLDEGERGRADQLRSGTERRRFVVAHAALRHIVGGRLGAPAGAIRWERGPHGKPALCGRWTGIEANLSHSGGLSLVAVTASRPVGVDVQWLGRQLDVVAMAQRYFRPEEAGFVRDSPDPAVRADRFARLWTRKEALVKAGGGRLIPHGMPAPVQSEGDAVVEYPDEARPGRYRVTGVPAPPGFWAAVALSGADGFRVESREWSWEGADPA
jgi:4'-phosphopantetheinyl transferase